MIINHLVTLKLTRMSKWKLSKVVKECTRTTIISTINSADTHAPLQHNLTYIHTPQSAYGACTATIDKNMRTYFL